MHKRFLATLTIAFVLAASAPAQNTNSPTTATRQTTPRTQSTPRKAPTATSTPSTTAPGQTNANDASAPRTRSRRTGTTANAASGQTRAASAVEPGAQAVRGVFDTLIKNIERSDVDAVMSLYWNSSQLTIFNNNGTVTRGWEQVRANRASSYPDAKNVKIEARDVKVQMLGRDGAIVTSLWRQSQEFRGTPESSAGRLTVVFRLINSGWKIVHTHSSPEAPDPSRLAPSDQTAPARPAATPPPSR
jgi:ketosteroid isomerase-like protein